MFKLRLFVVCLLNVYTNFDKNSFYNANTYCKKCKRKEVIEFVIVFIVKIKAMANPFDLKISSDLIIGLKNNAFISLFLME